MQQNLCFVTPQTKKLIITDLESRRAYHTNNTVHNTTIIASGNQVQILDRITVSGKDNISLVVANGDSIFGEGDFHAMLAKLSNRK